MEYEIKRLQYSDLGTLKNVLLLFSRVFENKTISHAELPDDAYLGSLLKKSEIYIFAALDEEEVIGALIAYELALPTKKERELYLYDLAVDEKYRRQGVASSLVRELKVHARKNGISLIFVEAESEDLEAVHFYNSLNAERSKVDHFTIIVG